MKTLLSITMLLALLGASALNPAPLREGPGEGAELLASAEQVTTASPRAALPQPLPPGSGVLNQVAEKRSSFATLIITLDPLGKPLGAYQFELTSAESPFKVLGVEGGDHAAYHHDRPPYFDPVVQEQGSDRLILAEYALPKLTAEALPTTPVVVAKVSVMFDRAVDANELPAITLRLITAGDADGQKIDAKLSHTIQFPSRSE